jgi:hypothetical protein
MLILFNKPFGVLCRSPIATAGDSAEHVRIKDVYAAGRLTRFGGLLLLTDDGAWSIASPIRATAGAEPIWSRSKAMLTCSARIPAPRHAPWTVRPCRRRSARDVNPTGQPRVHRCASARPCLPRLELDRGPQPAGTAHDRRRRPADLRLIRTRVGAHGQVMQPGQHRLIEESR